MPLVVHPAGRDEDLRLALEDLQADRWLATRDLILKTGSDWALRTSRSQVLAVAAARGSAVEAWLAEEPGNADALMMWARVLTQRALNTWRDAKAVGDLLRASRAARRACREAFRYLPYDPVAHVCWLALAPLYADGTLPGGPEYFADPPEAGLPRGPWPVWQAVRQRDPENREAHHRMLAYFHARGHGANEFAQWTASWARDGSALLTLPLYALTERYRIERDRGNTFTKPGYWCREHIRGYAERALNRWFWQVNPAKCALLDLNHLAFALTASGEGGAGPVFEAIGPYATPAPWKQGREYGFDPDGWSEDFLRGRAYALVKGGGGR
jgi:hypothetical protein